MALALIDLPALRQIEDINRLPNRDTIVLHNDAMLAFIEIVLLWLMIYETYIQFKKIDKIAGFLFIPYLAWVSFATVLNASIWWLNR